MLRRGTLPNLSAITSPKHPNRGAWCASFGFQVPNEVWGQKRLKFEVDSLPLKPNQLRATTHNQQSPNADPETSLPSSRVSLLS